LITLFFFTEKGVTAMALSLDLRQRIVKAYENGEGSIRQLAKRFSTGPASIFRILKRYQQKGELHPKSSPGSPPFIDENGLNLIYKFLQKDNDATLQELCISFAQKTGMRIQIVTMHRAYQRLKLRYKKNFISG
jgi:transposase